MTIYNLAHIATCQLTIVANLEFVGIYIVDAIAALQILAEICKSSREDGNLISISLKGSHESIHALSDRQFLGYLLHHTHVEALKQTDTTGETLLEVDLATHGALSNGTNLVTHPIALGQLVDTLGLDER